MVPQKECLHDDKINSIWMPQAMEIEDTGKCNVNIEDYDISVLASPCIGYPMNFLQTEKYDTFLGMHINCKMDDSEVISLCQIGSSKLHLDSKNLV